MSFVNRIFLMNLHKFSSIIIDFLIKLHCFFTRINFLHISCLPTCVTFHFIPVSPSSSGQFFPRFKLFLILIPLLSVYVLNFAPYLQGTTGITSTDHGETATLNGVVHKFSFLPIYDYKLSLSISTKASYTETKSTWSNSQLVHGRVG